MPAYILLMQKMAVQFARRASAHATMRLALEADAKSEADAPFRAFDSSTAPDVMLPSFFCLISLFV